MTEYLNPCPYCNKSASLFHKHHWDNSNLSQISCWNLACPVKPILSVYLQDGDSKTKAIERWNTRPIEDALHAENSRLLAEANAHAAEAERQLERLLSMLKKLPSEQVCEICPHKVDKHSMNCIECCPKSEWAAEQACSGSQASHK